MKCVNFCTLINQSMLVSSGELVLACQPSWGGRYLNGSMDNWSVILWLQFSRDNMHSSDTVWYLYQTLLTKWLFCEYAVIEQQFLTININIINIMIIILAVFFFVFFLILIFFLLTFIFRMSCTFYWSCIIWVFHSKSQNKI